MYLVYINIDISRKFEQKKNDFNSNLRRCYSFYFVFFKEKKLFSNEIFIQKWEKKIVKVESFLFIKSFSKYFI